LEFTDLFVRNGVLALNLHGVVIGFLNHSNYDFEIGLFDVWEENETTAFERTVAI
jgi:hypothetical protein